MPWSGRQNRDTLEFDSLPHSPLLDESLRFDRLCYDHSRTTLGVHQLWFNDGLQPLNESRSKHLTKGHGVRDSLVVVTNLSVVLVVWHSSIHFALVLSSTLFAAVPTASRSLLSHHSLAARHNPDISWIV